MRSSHLRLSNVGPILSNTNYNDNDKCRGRDDKRDPVARAICEYNIMWYTTIKGLSARRHNALLQEWVFSQSDQIYGLISTLYTFVRPGVGLLYVWCCCSGYTAVYHRTAHSDVLAENTIGLCCCALCSNGVWRRRVLIIYSHYLRNIK